MLHKTWLNYVPQLKAPPKKTTWSVVKQLFYSRWEAESVLSSVFLCPSEASK